MKKKKLTQRDLLIIELIAEVSSKLGVNSDEIQKHVGEDGDLNLFHETKDITVLENEVNKKLEGIEFLEKHNLAPRGWRGWLSKGRREF